MNAFLSPRKTQKSERKKKVRIIIVQGILLSRDRGKKSQQILENNFQCWREIKSLSCVPFVTLCPSLHLLLNIFPSLDISLFLAVFMFYAAIKTTRKQHNIIRYVLKILTKKNRTWRLVVKTTIAGSPAKLFLLSSSREFWFLWIQLFGASHRAPPSFHIYSYSNRDKFRGKNIIIYQLCVLIYACFLEAFAPKNILFSCVLKTSWGKFMFKCKSSDKLRLNEML